MNPNGTPTENPGDGFRGSKVSFTDSQNNPVAINPLDGLTEEVLNLEIYKHTAMREVILLLITKNFNKTLTAKLTWLICKHICIPEMAKQN